jgi:8-oxo-dGTP pyrophosphatase MutT (NUDIX family)
MLDETSRSHWRDAMRKCLSGGTSVALIKALSAGAIVLRDFEGDLKIALAHRKPNHKRSWVLPKGHVEQGETLEQTVKREVYEEAGLLDIQLIKHLGSIVRRQPKNGSVLQNTIHYYLAYSSATSGSYPPTDDSFIEVGWFVPPQMIDLLAYEDERQFFQEHLPELFR